jgi:hypothetical protein
MLDRHLASEAVIRSTRLSTGPTRRVTYAPFAIRE